MIVATGIAVAAFIVLLLVIVFGQKDAPPYWDE